MNLLIASSFKLPITDPVLVFAIISFIILVAPLVLKKARIPGIIGLILAGMFIGPHGIHLLERDESMNLFGTVGILYIMFLAGLEIELSEFNSNKLRGISFGLLTFIIPLTLGMVVCMKLLGFEWKAALLTASTFSSNTLIAYPIVSRIGIIGNRSVNTAVSGTMITDILALLILAVVASVVRGKFGPEVLAQLLLSFALFAFGVLFFYPKIGRYFFRKEQTGGVAQYAFVMTMVFLAGTLAKLAGLEAIIGAFLAGLALNKLIPRTSTLLNRIEFAGNALFIPFFLISVGMIVDLRIFMKGQTALILAGVMTFLGIFGKWIPAFIIQLLFDFNKYERKVLFGLTSAHAAATLAVIKEGFELGVLNEYVLNGSIIMILVSCLLSSFVVENAARKLAVIENEKAPDLTHQPERILVPVSSPDNAEVLIDFANLIKNARSHEATYALSVVEDAANAEENVLKSNKMLEGIQKYAAASDKPIQVITRVDLGIATGIVGTIKDLLISQVILGWGQKMTGTKDFIFGGMVDSLLRKSEKMILLCQFKQPLSVIKKQIWVVPPSAEFEKGFARWINMMVNLSRQKGMSVEVFATNETIRYMGYTLRKNNTYLNIKYTVFDDFEDFLALSKNIKENDLLIVVTARPASLSYQPSLDQLPRRLSKYFEEHNFVLLYPEQNIGQTKEMDFQLEGMDVSPIQENINRLNRLGKWFWKLKRT